MHDKNCSPMVFKLDFCGKFDVSVIPSSPTNESARVGETTRIIYIRTDVDTAIYLSRVERVDGHDVFGRPDVYRILLCHLGRFGMAIDIPYPFKLASSFINVAKVTSLFRTELASENEL